MLFLDGIGGIDTKGIFGISESWVDTSKPPGCSSQREAVGWTASIEDILSLRYFFFSPNLLWFLLAFAYYVAYPYDMESQLDFDAFLSRFTINFVFAFVYHAFFFAALYIFHLSSRKYVPNNLPTVGNMVHNLTYWTLAIAQWTTWEFVMLTLWSSKKVPLVTTDELLDNKSMIAKHIFWVMAVPIWRDLHFYVCHRYIHIRAIYKYVHSLHHRNTDPEPFSGITMHPIEHMYYFSNVLVPLLYTPMHPFVFMWLFVHLILSPAAAHSGFEDHFQSDQYHYIHHAKFECNYGSPGTAFLDIYCGTFREQLSYKTIPSRTKEWARESYLGLPQTATHAVYSLFTICLVPLIVWGSNHRSFAMSIASTVAVGPIVLAMLLCYLSGDRFCWRWPFQKESLFGTFGVFFAAGTLFCVVPLFHAVFLFLS